MKKVEAKFCEGGGFMSIPSRCRCFLRHVKRKDKRYIKSACSVLCLCDTVATGCGEVLHWFLSCSNSISSIPPIAPSLWLSHCQPPPCTPLPLFSFLLRLPCCSVPLSHQEERVCFTVNPLWHTRRRVSVFYRWKRRGKGKRGFQEMGALLECRQNKTWSTQSFLPFPLPAFIEGNAISLHVKILHC